MRNIKSEKELIGGQFYIRLTINLYGNKLIDVIRVLGSPYILNGKQKVKINYGCGRNIISDIYLSDLGVAKNLRKLDNGVSFCGSKLFRFTSENLKIIDKLSVWQSLAMINSPVNKDGEFDILEMFRIQNEWTINESSNRRIRQLEEEYWMSRKCIFNK